ncbi:MAG: DUF885 domain-containing protein [Phycisphaerales bacterium]|nr:DUF885 domain-containing protein [Phycisphaerales bacterium]
MRSIFPFLLCVAAVAPFARAAPASQPDAPTPKPPATPRNEVQAAEPAASTALKALLDEHMEFLVRIYPVEMGSMRGDERYNDKLSDLSPAAFASRRAEMQSRLGRLGQIHPSGLTSAERLNADLLGYELSLAIEQGRYFPEQMPINSLRGPHIDLPQLPTMLPFRTPKHYADYAARLEAIPLLLDQTIEQMRAGLAAKRVPPKVVLRQSVGLVRALASPAIERDPALSPFYAPFTSLPEADAGAARARAAISGALVPAYRRLADFLEKEYLPACRETLSISEGVDGPAAYQMALRYHTTTDLTADEIHQIGLDEVSRIRADMLKVIALTDWEERTQLEGDELISAFLEFLRTDKRFYFRSGEEILMRYRDLAKRIDPELPRLFKTLPRNTFGIKEMPPLAAKTGPMAYFNPGSIRSGVPGTFYANTFYLEMSPSYLMVSLTLHEAAPGHHFQLAIADELEGVHKFRTVADYTAYSEGWALYCERLGLEIGDAAEGATPAKPGDVVGGLYSDPYDSFGRLSDEILRAVRLVVDTGVHNKGWARDQVVRYMRDNTACSEAEIQSEATRYIGNAGQACAYKIGELTIRRLRARAEKELGPAFDLREFHDRVLGGGAMPMPVLEGTIDRWIEEAGVRNAGVSSPAAGPNR